MKKFVWLVFLAGLMVCLQGCISDASEDPDTKLPWNKPASWDGQQLGIPM